MAREQRRVDFVPEAFETVVSFDITPIIGMGEVHALRTSEVVRPGHVEHYTQYLSNQELRELSASIDKYLRRTV